TARCSPGRSKTPAPSDRRDRQAWSEPVFDVGGVTYVILVDPGHVRAGIDGWSRCKTIRRRWPPGTCHRGCIRGHELRPELGAALRTDSPPLRPARLRSARGGNAALPADATRSLARRTRRRCRAHRG